VGMGWGRVKSVELDGSGNVTRVTVDEPQDATDPVPTYAMRFRCQDGMARTCIVTFDAGQGVSAFNLAAPLAPIVIGGDPFPAVSIGDLFLFGISGQDSIPMLVSKIEPAADLAAKITAVDAAPDVLTADAGYIDSTNTYHAGLPPLISLITGAAWDYGATLPAFTPVPDFSPGTPTVVPQLSGSF
jgi:hypothetical protein